MSEKENIKIYHAVYHQRYKKRGICTTIRGEWLVEIPDLFEEMLSNYCDLFDIDAVKFSYLYEETSPYYNFLNVLAICSFNEPSFSRKRAVQILRGRRDKWFESRTTELWTIVTKDHKTQKEHVKIVMNINYKRPLEEIRNKWAKYICLEEVNQPKRDVI